MYAIISAEQIRYSGFHGVACRLEGRLKRHNPMYNIIAKAIGLRKREAEER